MHLCGRGHHWRMSGGGRCDLVHLRHHEPTPVGGGGGCGRGV